MKRHAQRRPRASPTAYRAAFVAAVASKPDLAFDHLYTAVMSGHYVKLEAILATPEAERFRPSFARLLREAASSAKPRAVQMLLRAGAKPEPGHDYLTFLISTTQPDYDAIKALLDAGADPNGFAQADGVQPLTQACMECDEVAVKLLLDAGADPTHMNAAALVTAAKHRDVESLQLLLDAGGNRFTAQHYARAIKVAEQVDDDASRARHNLYVPMRVTPERAARQQISVAMLRAASGNAQLRACAQSTGEPPLAETLPHAPAQPTTQVRL